MLHNASETIHQTGNSSATAVPVLTEPGANHAPEPLSAILSGPYGTKYQFISNDIPRPADGEALIRIDYSGVCHGDVYSRDGGGPAPAQPIRPLTGGHEGIGVILSLGQSQENQYGFAVGDRVGVAWRSETCGTCEACRCRAENHCPSQKVTGMHRNGTFQREEMPHFGHSVGASVD